MQQVETQLAVLVTASAGGDQIRRDFTCRGVALAGTTATLANLRRSLVRADDTTPIVFCITLDEPTLRRHGAALTRLLDDRCSFVAPVNAIALVIDGHAAKGWESLGCDAIATTSSQVRRLLKRFAQQNASPLVNRFATAGSGLDVLDSGSDRISRYLPRRVDTRSTDLRWPRP